MNVVEYRVKKHKNAYSVPKTCFLLGGDPHSVEISIKKESVPKLELKIDDQTVYEVEMKQQYTGNTVLTIDGLEVDFVWNLFQKPKGFQFFTRELSSDHNSGGDDGKSESDAKDWEDHAHIHLVQIKGI